MSIVDDNNPHEEIGYNKESMSHLSLEEIRRINILKILEMLEDDSQEDRHNPSDTE